MSDCKDCPHDIGDAYERDCAFPDCIGGWEEAFKGQCEKNSDLEEKLFQANEREGETLEREAILNQKIDQLQIKCDSFYRTIKEKRKRIKALENPWVSVDERLPEIGKVVLTEGSHTEPITAYIRVDECWYTYEFDDWVTGIHHWMPIPIIPESTND